MKIQGPKGLVDFVELVDVIQSVQDGIRQHIRTKIRQHKLDITFEMLEVLAVVKYNPGINQQEIAKAVRKNKASLTSLIDNLATRGLVRREPDPQDRRNNIIVLTKEGAIYGKRLLPMVADLYDHFQTGLACIDIQKITKTLRQLQTNIENGATKKKAAKK